MSEIRRRTPAIPDRSSEWLYRSQYVPLSEFQQPPAPANAVIGFRYGQDVLESPRAFVSARFLPFPYFQEAPAEIPAHIAFRFGRPLVAGDEPLVAPHHLPFPYFQQPASPVLPFRYGQTPLRDLEAFVSAAHYRFPYFPAIPTFIPFVRGQWLSDAVPFPPSVVARYFPFPYFEQPPAAPANPVIPIIARVLSELHVTPRHPVPQFYGYVESNEEAAPTVTARYIPTFRRRRR